MISSIYSNINFNIIFYSMSFVHLTRMKVVGKFTSPSTHLPRPLPSPHLCSPMNQTHRHFQDPRSDLCLQITILLHFPSYFSLCSKQLIFLLFVVLLFFE